MTGKYSVLLDLDGVISNTALLHAKAWKIVFDEVLLFNRIKDVSFAIDTDYFKFIDGKTRFVGIVDYLKTISISLPMGDHNSNGLETVCGIGNRKNEIFRKLIDNHGAEIFPDAIRLIKKLTALEIKIGLSSSSKNARYVLDKANLVTSFDSIMDGLVAEAKGVASKPHPEFYVYASKLIGRPPNQCVVIEDAISGVESAKRAGIGLVVGISRRGEETILKDHGADIVVSTLDDLHETFFINTLKL